jgi:hypothetical protein
MNKMAHCSIMTPIAAALVERVQDIVNRSARRRARWHSAPDARALARLANRTSKEN